METTEIPGLRHALGLTQSEFGQLFGVHAMTVSKWERGVIKPTAYQTALMRQFMVRASQKTAADHVKHLLVGAGVVAALTWLLGAR
jgi:DNA-binding transcriptional regulator YiaG